jgi:hypothetical protein
LLHAFSAPFGAKLMHSEKPQHLDLLLKIWFTPSYLVLHYSMQRYMKKARPSALLRTFIGSYATANKLLLLNFLSIATKRGITLPVALMGLVAIAIPSVGMFSPSSWW